VSATDLAAAAPALPVETAAALPRRGWIQSPAFDLAFFTLSPLVGLLVVIAALTLPHGMRISVAASFLLGMPHYLTTFTFYFGDENRAHYFAKPLTFIAAPVAILAAVAALRLWHLTQPVILAMFIWNIWHVSLQSSGILGIYRRLNGGPDSERGLAKYAVLTSAVAMTLWQPATFPPLTQLIESIAHGAYRVVTFTFVAAGVITSAMLVAKMLSRERRVSFAEGAFFASSILLFHPYLWVHDGNLATLGMLCGHFIQYLVIVWLLNARKYLPLSGSSAQQMLGRVSASPAYVCACIAGAGVTLYVFSYLATRFGAGLASIVFLNSLALVHFYLDGRIWAFKQPFVRRSIGPFLTPESRRVT
jgi:hypothetical protein